MMKVAVIALLAAPTALAFTPENLRGVWSCVVEDEVRMTKRQASVAAVGLVLQTATDSVWDVPATMGAAGLSSRVVVFDPMTTTKATRRFTGRTYYTHGANTEEHDIHGFLSSANDGEFYLDENYYNEECTPFAGVATNPTAESIAANKLHPVILKGSYGTGAATVMTTAVVGPPAVASVNAGKVPGSCRDKPEGPFTFHMLDADHFTLIIDPTDMQLNNYLAPIGASSNANVDRIHSVENCMRGLPEKSTMCGMLARSGISTATEKDNACQGQLKCHIYTTAEPYGCTTTEGECCSFPLAPAPVYYPQPQYYQPQPQYYQPQPFYQPQPAQQGNPFAFYGR